MLATLIAAFVVQSFLQSASQPATQPAAGPIDPREGVPVVAWQDARQHIGKPCIVQGKIFATKNIGSICFLNFDDPQARSFTAVIRKDDFANFPQPPEIAYRDKWVRIFGDVRDYQGKPEITVRRPDQIEVLPAEPAPPEPAPPRERPPSDTIKIATYNILNLFDEHDDPYTGDEGTRTKPRPELERVAATIRKLDADVLALQEVESRGYVERFATAMLADMGYTHIAHVESNDRRGIDCAVLSRLPVGPVTSYRHLTFPGPDGSRMSFHRDLLRVRIAPPGATPFDAFVVHLKSKETGSTSDAIRLAEARQARAILDAVLSELPDARFVICGDFNDLWDSDSLKTLRGGGGAELKCFVQELPPDRHISYNKPPHRSMIDFILCSPAMAKQYVAGSYEIVDGTVESSGSDHNPVAARFRVRE